MARGRGRGHSEDNSSRGGGRGGRGGRGRGKGSWRKPRNPRSRNRRANGKHASDHEDSNSDAGGSSQSLRKSNPSKWKNVGGDSVEERYIKARSDLRENGVKAGTVYDIDRSRLFNRNTVFKATCEEMCPELERVERMRERDVLKPEKDENGNPDEDRMVKKYKRPAAGNDEPLPSEVRTAETLQKTIDYLLFNVVNEAPDTESFRAIHTFLWDRTRQIRTDFTIQGTSQPGQIQIAIDCFERIARFHILSMHELSGTPANNNLKDYSWYQDREQLNNTLKTLIDLYSRASYENYEPPNESEFKAYYIILAIDHTVPDIESKYQSNQFYRKHVQDPEIEHALRLYDTAKTMLSAKGPLKPNIPQVVNQQNSEKFWDLVGSEKTSYLMACCAESQSNHIRVMTLRNIWSAHNRPGAQPLTDWTPEELAKVLKFNEKDAQAYCEAFNFNFKISNQEKLYMDLKSIRFFPHDPFPNSQFRTNVVEKKRMGLNAAAVIHDYSLEAAQKEGLLVPTNKVDEEKSLFVGGESSEDEVEPEKVTQNTTAPLMNGFGSGTTVAPQNPFSTFRRPSPPMFQQQQQASNPFATTAPSFGAPSSTPLTGTPAVQPPASTGSFGQPSTTSSSFGKPSHPTDAGTSTQSPFLMGGTRAENASKDTAPPAASSAPKNPFANLANKPSEPTKPPPTFSFGAPSTTGNVSSAEATPSAFSGLDTAGDTSKSSSSVFSGFNAVPNKPAPSFTFAKPTPAEPPVPPTTASNPFGGLPKPDQPKGDSLFARMTPPSKAPGKEAEGQWLNGNFYPNAATSQSSTTPQGMPNLGSSILNKSKESHSQGLSTNNAQGPPAAAAQPAPKRKALFVEDDQSDDDDDADKPSKRWKPPGSESLVPPSSANNQLSFGLSSSTFGQQPTFGKSPTGLSSTNPEKPAVPSQWAFGQAAETSTPPISQPPAFSSPSTFEKPAVPSPSTFSQPPVLAASGAERTRRKGELFGDIARQVLLSEDHGELGITIQNLTHEAYTIGQKQIRSDKEAEILHWVRVRFLTRKFLLRWFEAAQDKRRKRRGAEKRKRVKASNQARQEAKRLKKSGSASSIASIATQDKRQSGNGALTLGSGIGNTNGKELVPFLQPKESLPSRSIAMPPPPRPPQKKPRTSRRPKNAQGTPTSTPESSQELWNKRLELFNKRLYDNPTNSPIRNTTRSTRIRAEANGERRRLERGPESDNNASSRGSWLDNFRKWAGKNQASEADVDEMRRSRLSQNGFPIPAGFGTTASQSGDVSGDDLSEIASTDPMNAEEVRRTKSGVERIRSLLRNSNRGPSSRPASVAGDHVYRSEAFRDLHREMDDYSEFMQSSLREIEARSLASGSPAPSEGARSNNNLNTSFGSSFNSNIIPRASFVEDKHAGLRHSLNSSFRSTFSATAGNVVDKLRGSTATNKSFYGGASTNLLHRSSTISASNPSKSRLWEHRPSKFLKREDFAKGPSTNDCKQRPRFDLSAYGPEGPTDLQRKVWAEKDVANKKALEEEEQRLKELGRKREVEEERLSKEMMMMPGGAGGSGGMGAGAGAGGSAEDAIELD